MARFVPEECLRQFRLDAPGNRTTVAGSKQGAGRAKATGVRGCACRRPCLLGVICVALDNIERNRDAWLAVSFVAVARPRCWGEQWDLAGTMSA